MKKSFKDALSSSTLVFDGATGTEIYRRHIFTNQCYDELNLRNPRLIAEIAKSYYDVGVDVLTTNTYGANRFALERYGSEKQVEAINRTGVEIVRKVISETTDETRNVYIAGSVGYPSDEILIKRSRSEIIDAFTTQVQSLIANNVDCIIFETQPSREVAELMAEIIQNTSTNTPFIVSYGLKRTLFQTPNTLESRSQYYSQLFAPFKNIEAQPIAWGINCILGPNEMLDAVQEIVKTISLPLIVQPNAGTPQSFEGRQLYYSSPEYLATYSMRYAELGVAAVGGCCGTTPEEMAEVVKMVKPTSKSRRSEIILLDKHNEVKEQDEFPAEQRSSLARKLYAHEWVQTVEAIPPCGYDMSAFVEKAQLLKEAGIDAVNLPDGPRASARITSVVAAQKVLEEANIEPVLHVCCRDRNLIGLQADLIGCAALNIKNILFITGDPPKLGNYPNATGVFDCDSIGLCALQQRLNRGVDLAGQSIGNPTQAFFGCGFDPSALNRQRELERLKKKIDAGALFAVSQPIFDPDALLRFIDDFGGLPIPIIAGVWPFISYRNALFMRKEVPGVIVPEEIMIRMEKASTVSKEAQLEEGIQIARESLARLRSSIQGVQVSAPLGRIDVSLKVLES